MADGFDPKTVYVPFPRPQARLVLYGIAHAGAGAYPWRAVANSLPEWVETRGIRLPGRENRTKAPVHAGVDAAAAEIAAAIETERAARDRPVVIAGSCFGAVLATAAAGRVPVSGLLAVRQPAPEQLYADGGNPAAMAAAPFRQWVIAQGNIPAEVLDEGGFELFEPLLRADLDLIEGFTARDGSLECPVHLVNRPAADAVPDAAHWSRVTSGPVTSAGLEVPGDPLTCHPEALARAVERFLRQLSEAD